MKRLADVTTAQVRQSAHSQNRLAYFGLLLLHAYDCDLGEALLDRGRHQVRSDAAHFVFGNDAVAALVALDADLERYIEEDGVNFVLIILGQLDPVLAVLGREVGRVHIVRGTLGDEPRFEHGAEIGKDEILKTLFANRSEERRVGKECRSRWS